MKQTLFVLRHGKAEGQEPEAPLTADGHAQAQVVADVLAGFGIDLVVSSTFRRAVDSIRPLATRLGLTVETDNRLVEASLSTINYPDWLDRLRATFDDYDLCYEGGESSRAATARAVAAVTSVFHANAHAPVIVTHGRLMTLLLKHFDNRFGFDNWRALSAPDLFQITVDDSEQAEVTRLWK